MSADYFREGPHCPRQWGPFLSRRIVMVDAAVQQSKDLSFTKSEVCLALQVLNLSAHDTTGRGAKSGHSLRRARTAKVRRNLSHGVLPKMRQTVLA